MEILKKLNVPYQNISLYEQAFTHTSYANEVKGRTSNERIEFLGDAVLELIASEYIYKTYPNLVQRYFHTYVI